MAALHDAAEGPAREGRPSPGLLRQHLRQRSHQKRSSRRGPHVRLGCLERPRGHAGAPRSDQQQQRDLQCCIQVERAMLKPWPMACHRYASNHLPFHREGHCAVQPRAAAGQEDGTRQGQGPEEASAAASKLQEEGDFSIKAFPNEFATIDVEL